MIRSKRIKLAHSVLGLFAVAILAKAVQVQLVDGRDWRRRAERQQVVERTVPAPRGDIFDATRRVLAQSAEQVRLEIAPREVTQPGALRRALLRLDVDRRVVARALDPSSKYLVVPGRFLATDAAPAMALSGVKSFAAITRAYNVSPGAQGILGHVDADNKPVDGLELSLDSILRGVPGAATIIRDSKGKLRESPTSPGIAPVKGNSVMLTINADLQEIAEKALADAVARMGAEGGDIVILDPHSGEILAVASRRMDPRETSATVLTEPFEPGSTMKPFLAAGLLERGLVSDGDSVDTGDGVLEMKGRSQPIRDEHLVGRAPLSEVLKWSSNIGIVKFSSRLNERQEFETLRDFGFGNQTGLPFPTESPGTLRAPKSWSLTSASAMAMGYEISVTPLQLAAAYATFANGGELVEPALVKQIIGSDGVVRYAHRPRVIRRVMAKPVAEKMRHMLLDVVDEGTALEAALDNYALAGKTGTPRGTVRGHYVPGRYNPNFVGIFPGDNPQYVIVVKLTAPQTSIFAAKTAAPVTKAILQAAIAAGNAALDRGRLASSVVPTKKSSTAGPEVRQAGAPRQQVADAADSPRKPAAPYVVTLPVRRESPPSPVVHAVPDVRGLALRDAVRSLHGAGFRVQLAGSSGRGDAAAATSPAHGELIPTGSVVRLVVDY
jgi:cell division protein FtsI (penicillin-binding protein 3)